MSGMPLPPGEPAPQADALRDEVAQLHEAVRSQRDIGVAIGLVSARFGCSTDQAWRTMLRVSQDSNTKVRTVARVLVATHDGTADAEDREVLQSIVHHLPASGWPEGRPPRG
ncbi:ANTAR domain-containing protein [Nocardioides ganghwensis]|jgi:tellurite resistance protein|uniref:ANTAR domain-containing protein n=2 Tax=Nocardioides ganghwensis TaxID=252230 RepID=A0A4Q2SFJ9_9ACTN|nr:ANTAR domain-containing protein [Nocardioides ganghwensis]